MVREIRFYGYGMPGFDRLSFLRSGSAYFPPPRHTPKTGRSEDVTVAKKAGKKKKK